jgi:hypothetical protein
MDRLYNIKSAIEQLNNTAAQLTDSPHDGGDLDDGQRQAIINAAERVLAAAKTPTEHWVDPSVQTTLLAAVRLFYEWKVWDEIPLEGSISYAELASKVDTNPSLLGT